MSVELSGSLLALVDGAPKTTAHSRHPAYLAAAFKLKSRTLTP